MIYTLKNDYIALNESNGILQNRTIHPVELITDAAAPAINTPGLIIRSGENFSYACVAGKTAYARCVTRGAEALIVVEDCVNFKRPASGGSAGAGAMIDDAVAVTDKTWSSKKISDAIVAAGGSGGASYSQITKLNVTATSLAPKTVELPIANTTTFALPPVEVLKFIPGPQDVVTTACSFDNADADDFTVGGKSGEQADDVAFDGTMRLKTTYDVAVGAPAALADGFVSESEKINFADYKAVEEVG